MSVCVSVRVCDYARVSAQQAHSAPALTAARLKVTFGHSFLSAPLQLPSSI